MRRHFSAVAARWVALAAVACVLPTSRGGAAVMGRGAAVVPRQVRVPLQPPPWTPPPAATRSELWGFAAPWDPRSAATVLQHGAALSVVISGWLRFDTLSALPTPAYPDTTRLARGTRRFVLVTTYARNRFHPEIVRQLATDGPLRLRAATRIARWAAQHRYRGIVLDFESLTPADSDALRTVVRAIADAAHRHHVHPVVVAVPPADTVTYAARRLTAADLLLPMLYDEHWSTGAPGPIASPDWVRQLLAPWIASAGAARLVAALPVYGYLWHPPAPATVLSFADAQSQAAAAGVTLRRDSSSATFHYTRPDSAEGWVSDAGLLDTLMHQSRAAGIHRFALWRLGLEDPQIWRSAISD